MGLRRALRRGRGKAAKVELVLTAYYDGGARVGAPLVRKIRLR